MPSEAEILSALSQLKKEVLELKTEKDLYEEELATIREHLIKARADNTNMSQKVEFFRKVIDEATTLLQKKAQPLLTQP